MDKNSMLTNIIKQEQIFVFLSLVAIISIAWFSILNSMVHFDFAAAAAMWAAMMVAMMLPSAIPMIMVFSAVNRKRAKRRVAIVPTWIFTAGYAVVWLCFSLLAAGTQFILHSLALLSPELAILNPAVSGFVLIAAGLYQFTRIKNVCLRNCQTPMDFLAVNWREGRVGALLTGIKHGIYCLGCCWFLMALLFVAGVMNLLWIAVIAAFVLVEKVFPFRWITRAAGIALIALGTWTIATLIYAILP
jgi:predicted metal-binding membrane protein